jgi:hypothetical protein
VRGRGTAGAARGASQDIASRRQVGGRAAERERGQRQRGRTEGCALRRRVIGWRWWRAPQHSLRGASGVEARRRAVQVIR